MATESGHKGTALSRPHMIAVVAVLSEFDDYRERFVADPVAVLKELEIPVTPDTKPTDIELPDKQTLKKFLRALLENSADTRNAMVIYPYICN